MIKSKATIAELRGYRDKILKSKTFEEAKSNIIEMFYQMERVFEDLDSAQSELRKLENRIKRLEHNTNQSEGELKKLRQDVGKLNSARSR